MITNSISRNCVRLFPAPPRHVIGLLLACGHLFCACSRVVCLHPGVPVFQTSLVDYIRAFLSLLFPCLNPVFVLTFACLCDPRLWICLWLPPLMGEMPWMFHRSQVQQEFALSESPEANRKYIMQIFTSLFSTNILILTAPFTLKLHPCFLNHRLNANSTNRKKFK